MSNPSRTSWREKFTPPPPPDLIPVPAVAVVPAAVDDDAEPGPGTASDSIPLAGEQPASSGPEDTTEPEGTARTPETRAPRSRDRSRAVHSVPDGPQTTPTTARDRGSATALLTRLTDAGVDAHLVGVRQRSRSTILDVGLARSQDGPAAVQLAETLAETLQAAEVRASYDQDTKVARFQVFTAPAEADTARKHMVYVPIEVRDAVSYVIDPEETVTDFFLAAFNEHYDSMASFFPRRRVAPGPMPQTPKLRRRRQVASPVQMWVYLTPQQRDTLDDAVEEFNAGNRSALITRLFQEEISSRRAANT